MIALQRVWAEGGSLYVSRVLSFRGCSLPLTLSLHPCRGCCPAVRLFLAGAEGQRGWKVADELPQGGRLVPPVEHDGRVRGKILRRLLLAQPLCLVVSAV